MGGSVVFEDGVDDGPGCLDAVFPGRRPVAGKGVEALVGLLLARLRVEQGELPLVADELLTRPFDPGGDRDHRIRREPDT